MVSSQRRLCEDDNPGDAVLVKLGKVRLERSRHIIGFAWEKPQPWLNEPETLLAKVALFNRISGETIADC